MNINKEKSVKAPPGTFKEDEPVRKLCKYNIC